MSGNDATEAADVTAFIGRVAALLGSDERSLSISRQLAETPVEHLISALVQEEFDRLGE